MGRFRASRRRAGESRRRVVLGLAAVWAIAVAGCEGQAPTPQSSDKLSTGATVVFIGPPKGGLYWRAILGGAVKTLSTFPAIRLEPLVPADDTDNALRDTIDRALSLKPDVLCLYTTDTDRITDVAQRLFDAGVPLITVGPGPKIEKCATHVRIDLAGGANLLGKQLPAILGDRHSYVLVSCQGRSRIDTECYVRFKQGARQHSGIHLLDERCAAKSEDEMADQIRDMLAIFPHTALVVTLRPDVWFDHDPVMLLRDNTRLATLGASPQLWPLLRSGRAAALCGPIDGQIGGAVADAAIVVITHSRPFSTVHTISCELVRPDSFDDFARRYAKASGLPLSALLPSASSRPARPASAP